MEPSKSTGLNNQDCSHDEKPLLERDVIYTRRWYVLLVFSYAALVQTAVWNTFGPISQSAKLVFGWTDAMVGMFANWGNIMFFIFMIPMAWIMDVKGMRLALIVSSTLIMMGTSIRCITSEPQAATWLMTVGAILNGIGGTVPFAGSALISATWFPPNQRATSTSISTVASFLGYSVAFLLGPCVVPEPPFYDAPSEILITKICLLAKEIQTSQSSHKTLLKFTIFGLLPLFASNTEQIKQSKADNVTVATPDHITGLERGIMNLMYIECAAGVVLFLSVVAYFPSKPPSPPSLTASIQRTSYGDGLKQLFKHKQFLLLLLAYSIPTGVVGVFGSVLNLILHKVHISQTTTGWLGFYSVIGGCIAQLVLSRVSDIFLRHMKMMLVILFLLATAFTAWFVGLQVDMANMDIVSLFIAYILSGVFVSGSVPLFYELSCEASYPIAEGVTIGVMTLVNNLTGIIFLTVLQISQIGVLWMNWALLGSITVTVPLLCLFKAQYTRTNLDTEIIVPSTEKDHKDKGTPTETKN